MVKVQEEEPQGGGAGGGPAGTGGRRGVGQPPPHGPGKVPPAGTSNVATQHFHYHWSYPSAASPSPATFHFGPGFEPQTSPQQHVVYFHVNPGVTVSFQMGDNVQVIKGPVTVPMVSTNSSPPIAMPVQVPHGHVVQQIVDESGTLRHVILSPQHPPIVPIPPHFGPGPASGSNQPHQQFFAPQGLPPGYPPFGHGAPLQPGLLGHVHPNQQGHSPPPAHTFHKDERAQRQYNKLRKKFEQKQVRGVTPPSPRKEFVNGIRPRKSMGGGGSVGTSEDGDGESSSVQDEDDESSLALLIDFLTNIKPPQVADVTSRSVLLQWWPPDCKANPEVDVTESDIRYEVLLSDKGKEGKYKPIYSGAALSCRVQDLRPGTEYSVCVTAWVGGAVGSASEPTSLRTPPCEPDMPSTPKLIMRTRTTLQLKWTAAVDNGAHISQYVLESDPGSGEWSEVYRGKGKQCNLAKLQPATSYKFRLSAVNECGRSECSEEVLFWTSDSPPSQPAPPALLEASVTALSLGWKGRPCDEDFTLQMEDRESGHGYLAVYSGKDTLYVCSNLNRHTFYKFRLKAHNMEGPSQWSEEVGYRTLPARPCPPVRLTTKGRIHAHSFKVKWEPPVDRGGADITSYTLQIKKNGEFIVAYIGMETECVIDRLNPGTQYEVRIGCETAGGRSDFSEPMVVATEPVCPGQCATPRVHGKPRPHSVALTWSYPDTDGGSPVTDFELVMRSAENDSTNTEQVGVYQGSDTECVVNELLPGHRYLFLLRASNRVGAGNWSEPLEVRSGAAPPGPMTAPILTPILTPRGHSMSCTWAEPPHNGSPILEYRLELAHGSSLEFASAYQGQNTSFEVRTLPPATLCHFRLHALSGAGWSDCSPVTSIMSPPGPPGVVAQPHYTATPTSVHVSWSAPPDHGDPILHYTVDTGEQQLTAEDTSCEIHDLVPHTTYKVRVRAVNGVGIGPYSPTLKAMTLPLPPAPPPLTCANVGHNYLKLKWGEGKNSTFTSYTVYMTTSSSTSDEEFDGTIVYQGLNYTCKVNRLQEQTPYRFCVSAENDAGLGPLSDIQEFTTAIAPPPSLKGTKVIEAGVRSCTVEWQSARRMGNDPILYCVQLARLKHQEYKQVYLGPETKTSVADLEPGAEYLVRVAPVRQNASGDLNGPFSQPVTFSTLPLPDQRTVVATPKPHHSQATARKQLSDQEWAIIILCGFSLVAVLVAVVVHHFIY